MSVVHVSYLYTNLNVIGIVVLFLLTNSTNFLLSPRMNKNQIYPEIFFNRVSHFDFDVIL